MKEKTDVAIVGGGAHGCSIAYYLAKKGMEVTVFDRSFLCSGATGRCAGGIRQQFATRENIELAKRSVELFDTLEQELNHNLRYKQRGYLIPVHTTEEKNEFLSQIRLQNEMGINSEWLEPEQIKEIVPALNVEGIGVIGAAWCATDGSIDPFRLTHAYAENAKRLGAEICTYTPVTDVLVNNGEVKGLQTKKGQISANVVIAAAGAWTKEIAKMAGIDLPTFPERHEICVTEKLDHFLEPMIIDYHYNTYFRQTEEGGVLGGWGGYAPKDPSYETKTSLKFLQTYGKLAEKFLPKMTQVNILRQWAGFYDVSPDAKPILGKTSINDFLVVCGFSGHGLMLSPVVGELMSELVRNNETSMSKLMDDLSVQRFTQRKVEKEKGVVG